MLVRSCKNFISKKIFEYSNILSTIFHSIGKLLFAEFTLRNSGLDVLSSSIVNFLFNKIDESIDCHKSSRLLLKPGIRVLPLDDCDK